MAIGRGDARSRRGRGRLAARRSAAIGVMVRPARTVLLGRPNSWVERSGLCASAPSTVQAPSRVELAAGAVRQRLAADQHPKPLVTLALAPADARPDDSIRTPGFSGCATARRLSGHAGSRTGPMCWRSHISRSARPLAYTLAAPKSPLRWRRGLASRGAKQSCASSRWLGVDRGCERQGPALLLLASPTEKRGTWPLNRRPGGSHRGSRP